MSQMDEIMKVFNKKCNNCVQLLDWSVVNED